MPAFSAPFLVDIRDCFAPSQLCVLWRDEAPPSDPAFDALVAETWSAQSDIARREGRMLFNGRMARYLRHRRDGDLLTIEAGPTDYATFLATNVLNAHRGDEIGWDRFAHPIGTSAVVRTRDGQLLFGRRNERVACQPGGVHTFGGTLEAAEVGPDGRLDAFASMLRELSEELSLTPEDVEGIICLGLIRDPAMLQPELVFDVSVILARGSIESRLDGGDPEAEHAEILGTPDQPDGLLTFLQNTPSLTPIAVGAAMLHGWRCFGPAWYDAGLPCLPCPESRQID